MADNEIPVGKSYDGPSGGIKKESFWLASEDLPLGREVSVEVEDVKLYFNVKFEKGRKEPVVGSLKFKGKEKEMILNATNRKVMNRMFTTNTAQWRGKIIRIYVDERVKSLAGEIVNGLRIKYEAKVTEIPQ